MILSRAVSAARISRQSTYEVEDRVSRGGSGVPEAGKDVTLTCQVCPRTKYTPDS